MTISVKYTAVKQEFETGSRKKVLRNKLRIKNVKGIKEKEFEYYIIAEKLLIKKFSSIHSFTLDDIKLIHKVFLGNIYEWAGEIRTVDISKDDFPFAKVKYLPTTLKDFEINILKKFTPSNTCNLEECAYGIAVVHTEFLIIHPFREGNGRTARLLATLMAYQSGYPGIKFDFIRNRGKYFDKYIAAIQEADLNNYAAMKEIMVKGSQLGAKEIS